MAKPTLLVIAGCNGAGKSSYSKAFTQDGYLPFDYDHYFLSFYKGLHQSEFQDTMAHNMAYSELESQVNLAILNGKNFCYETNFNSDPMFWPTKFKDAGYSLQMIFLCLDSVQTAKERVNIRVNNGGHFVPEKEIEARFDLGYKHLDHHFAEFNNIHILDASPYKQSPEYCFSLSENVVEKLDHFPSPLKSRIPSIYQIIEKYKSQA